MKNVIKRLLRNPLYTVAVVSVLSIGLGVAMALYAIVDATMFRPLNIENPDRVVRIFRTDETQKNMSNWSRPYGRDYLAGSGAFSDVALYASWGSAMLEQPDSQPRQVSTGLVSGNFFEVLGVRPELGRLIFPADEQQGRPAVAVLSYRFWQQLGGEKSIIGETLQLHGETVTVIGVLQEDYTGVELGTVNDLFMPVTSVAISVRGIDPEGLLHNPGFSWLEAVGRLQPGVSVAQAQRALDTRRLAAGEDESSLPHAKVIPARDVAIDVKGAGALQQLSFVLLGLVGILMLSVAADVGGLMLVRAETQRTSTGIQMSMGATRGRIATEVLFESGVLTTLAMCIAMFVAMLVVRWLNSFLGSDLALPDNTRDVFMNARVVIVLFGMLLFVTLVTGLAPMRRIIHQTPMSVLRGTRGADVARGPGLRDFLVATQVAFGVVLVVSAVMFIGALRSTLNIDLGFETDNRSLARVSQTDGIGDMAVFGELLDAVRNDPRVESAALVFMTPVVDSGMRQTVEPEGYQPAEGENLHIDIQPISDGYFRTLRIPLMQGEDIRVTEPGGDVPLIVNQEFVDRYWPDGTPLGKQVVGLFRDERPTRVVGVVANNRQRSLHEKAFPIVYVPYTQMFFTGLEIVAQSSSPELAMAAIRENAERYRARLSMDGGTQLQKRIDALTARDRAMTTLATGSAVFTCMLAIVGIYGVAAFSSRHRRREIGIRYALGASRGNVVLRFLRRGLLVALAGIAVGVGAGGYIGSQLRGVIQGAGELSTVMLLLAAGLMALVALLANLLPVWRAAAVDPMDVLRDE